MKNYSQALACVSKLIATVEPSVDGICAPTKWKLLRGNILCAMKRLDDATRIASEALRIDPTNPDALYLKAMVLFRESEHSKALAHCTEALRCDPDHSKARNLLKVMVLWCD
ncbi:hypothetical protein K493DRAFT_51893 [Basidiobolus meristosporus CBS 931.73]|uniref:Uncharacterized protein n=1 Tax=Basidiobolus meristosporus CBS 931.73 TaxID=1314790 RepID=A0A1Y1Z3P6_9FUNG|nr:hypothetical protein K493DRAFT_51893 [Basidiobolus meristosporus CBS 931.73]|eukprot:ORY04597.1 hypothetical protein K493DRAFT_51893 [Basidiobolus meristosporus CBS 931.73]